MAQFRYEITFTRRDFARIYWPAAMASLRARGLLFSPRAWLLLVKYFVAFVFRSGGER